MIIARCGNFHRFSVWIFAFVFILMGIIGCGNENISDPPQVLNISPNDGDTNIPVNTNISVIFSQPMDSATIEGTTNFILKKGTIDGDNVTGAVSYNSSTYSAIYNPDDNLEPETIYTVSLTQKIKSSDGTPLVRDYEWTFTTGQVPDKTSPTFSGATSAEAEGPHAIRLTWDNASDDRTEANLISYLIFMAEGSGAQNYKDISYRTALGVTSYKVTGLDPETTYYFVVLARDEAENRSLLINEVSATTDAVVEADTTPPAVSSFRPVEGAINVAVETNIVVTFSEDMDSTSINSTTVTLTKVAGGSQVSGEVSYNPSTETLTFDPTANLTAGTSYRLTLTTGIKDNAGNPLEQETYFSFTTQ